MKKKTKKEKTFKGDAKKKPSRKEETPVYVQLSPEEFMNSRRDILSYQMALIKIMKAIKKYNLLEAEEIAIEINLQNKLKQVNESIKQIESNFPKTGEYKPKQKGLPEKKPTVEYYDQNLEYQLEQIRRKLEEIGK